MSNKVLGIDLGTTNSAMAVIEAGKPKIVESAEGNRTTPSMVAVAKNNERLVGHAAKRQAVTNPKNTLYSVKRLIGRRFSDAEVESSKKILPYEIIQKGEGVAVKLGDAEHTPEEISAMILQKLKADAEERTGGKFDKAVITVPAYFNDSQRQATKDAGKIAGLDVLRIINEPTAAALAYGFDKKVNQKIAVYDLGGGTFDISILEVSEDTIQVKSTNGDTHLGGDDFDRVLIDHIVEEFKKEQGIDISSDPLALQRIKEAAEKAKIELSSANEAEINQPFITADASGPKHLLMKITRAKFESMISVLVDKTLEPVKKALDDAEMKPGDINEIIMVGGMTRIPFIQKKVEAFFGKKPNVSVNPDEVVALGAAVQGGVIQGDVHDVLLLDVTPLSLGIETLGGVMTKVIERNTTVPVRRSQVFSTAADGQTSVEIHVLQGEREMANDNKSLGRFILSDIPSAPRGVPQIEVTFDIDANSILHVSAKDKGTNKEQKITISGSTGLSEDEINKMKDDAEKHAEEDKKKRHAVDAKNNAESLVYTTEKMLSEHKDVLEEVKKPVEAAVAKLKESMKSDNAEAIVADSEALQHASLKLGEEVYKHTADKSKEGESGSEESDVKDAQYEEKKDDSVDDKKDV